MKPSIVAACILFAFASTGLRAQTHGWQPSAGHTQIAIWPGTPPDAQPLPGPETVSTSSGKDGLIAGKPTVGVTNVSRPTMTIYSPNGKNTGVAVVVFPGGGFEGLAIDLEGTEVFSNCDWRYSIGLLSNKRDRSLARHGGQALLRSLRASGRAGFRSLPDPATAGGRQAG